MNKVSRLAALLLAVLLFAFAGAALAEEDGETVEYTGTETNISLAQLLGIAQSEASLNLYNDFMKAETVAAMATAIRNACNDEEVDYISLMQEFTAEQIAALVARAEELYQLDPTEENLADLEEIKDVLYRLQNGSEAMTLAIPTGAIYFDISKGNVTFTDGKYSGKNSSGTTVSGTHKDSNVYVVSGKTTQYGISIGSKSDDSAPVAEDGNYTIYLNNVDIRLEGANKCAFYVACTSKSNTVAVILTNGTNNILYSGKGRAGLEKSWNQCTLVVACETGYANWVNDHTKGHSACSSCGSLDARSGNAWYGGGAETYYAGAGIGSGGYGNSKITSNGGFHKLSTNADGKEFTNGGINNRLWNLTIAGGKIYARGAWGSGGSGDNQDASGGGAAIGTGAARDMTFTACDIQDLNITGGIIDAYRTDNSAANIGGGYRAGNVEINIYGGVINAGKKQNLISTENIIGGRVRLRAAAIGAGGGGTSTGSESVNTVVNIYGGIIDAYGQYGAAIGGGAGGISGQARAATVNISGGTINATTEVGYGAAIGTGGSTGDGRGGDATITISGTPTIVANSVNGADIGGGGTNGTLAENVGGKGTVTITGGKITALSGGIGGGRANNANGGAAEVHISGAGTVINAVSIGGGLSAQKYGGDCTVTITAGDITVNNQNGASIGGGTGYTKGGNATVNISGGTLKTGSIGGGLATKAGAPIGFANATITGGTIQGQVVMASGSSTPCEFLMTGGTIDNSNSSSFYFIRDVGGAVYVENGTATLEGGTIKNCGTNQASGKNGTFEYGGAIYVTGGDFVMTGGTLESNTAAKDGGAVYVTKGNVKIGKNNCTNHAHPVLKNNSAENGGAVAVAGSTPIMYCGTMSDNSAATNGGAVYVTGGGFDMKDGTMTGNGKKNGSVVTKNGGAVYVTGTGSNFTMAKGVFTDNEAIDNGGAVYVGSGSFEITDFGTFTGHKATSGGAVYVSGGGFEMADGLLDNNEASADGGAVYVTGGDFTMYDGDLTNNDAVNGGAAYVTGTGSDFTMISGSMKNNTVEASSAAAAENGSEGYGGALYIKGGNVFIGVDGCNGEGTNHSKNYTEKEHPVIENNTAEFGGAMAVSGGSVYVYCGDVIKNNSDNRGTGENVFMDNGAFHHYLESSNIGEKEDHGMVSIGGELTIHHGTDQQFIITIRYFANTDNDLGEGVKAEWQGTAPKDYHLNLPYCPQSWRDAQNEQENPLTFTGWVQSQDGTQPDKIRAKENYSPIGTPVQIEDMSGTGAKEMYFYAVWAPKYNPITYAYTLNGTDILEPLDYTGVGTTKRNGGKEYYEFNMTSDTVNIGAPSMSGFAFLGWRIYATTANISNWDADAKSYPVETIDQIKAYADYVDYNNVAGAKPDFIDTNSYLLSNTLKTLQNFGDLVLVAVFDPMFSTLTITKAGSQVLDANANYIFNIKGDPLDEDLTNIDMNVTVTGNGTAIIEKIPVGTYDIKELDWGWRYDVMGTQIGEAQATTNKTVEGLEIINPEETYKVIFTNGNRETKWLDGEAVAEENQFTVNAGN